jgi:hypothetical protein
MIARVTHPTHTEPISRLAALLHGGWPRYCNALLALWLFISAFAWDHTPSSRMNTCLVGLFMLVSAITATGWAVVRHLTMLLAVWLAFTTLAAFPDGPASSWNNLIVALAAILLAELPDELGTRAGR